jgi:DNA-binding Lrp family transcriptional regulator
MLISNYQERKQRTADKQQRLLALLRDETWTSAPMIAQWLNLSLSAAYKTIASLEKKKLIKSFYVDDLKFKIWGITADGLLMSWQADEVMENRPYFQPSKIKPVMIQHHLDLQQARINAEKAGATNWVLGSLLPKNVGKRPDAITTLNNGDIIAIELERTVKTKKRYEVIFSHYLQEIKRGSYHQVHYVCPNNQFAARLARLFQLIESVPVAGERVRINDKHRDKFQVFGLSNWYQNDQKGLSKKP